MFELMSTIGSGLLWFLPKAIALLLAGGVFSLIFVIALIPCIIVGALILSASIACIECAAELIVPACYILVGGVVGAYYGAKYTYKGTESLLRSAGQSLATLITSFVQCFKTNTHSTHAASQSFDSGTQHCATVAVTPIETNPIQAIVRNNPNAVPARLLDCEITFERMQNPVLTVTGHSFERSAVAKSIDMQNKTPYRDTDTRLFTDKTLLNIIRNNEGHEHLQSLDRDLRCPLTNDFMSDPVLATDGFTYERAALLKQDPDRGLTPERTSQGKPIKNIKIKELTDAYLAAKPHQASTASVSSFFSKGEERPPAFNPELQYTGTSAPVLVL